MTQAFLYIARKRTYTVASRFQHVKGTCQIFVFRRCFKSNTEFSLESRWYIGLKKIDPIFLTTLCETGFNENDTKHDPTLY